VIPRALILVLLFSTAASAAPAIPAWARLARKLTGEGDAGRAAAVQALRATPGIEGKLRQALGTDRAYLALDVIVALNLKSLYYDVLEASGRDRLGFSYLALDALVDEKHQAGLAQLYVRRLENPSITPAAKVVILDSLTRMGERLDDGLLARLLLDDPSPEVRSAALYYLRGFLVDRRDQAFFPLLLRVLKSDLSRQRREQAFALVSELPSNLREKCGRLAHD
jgi:hypothetical protein